MRYDHRLIKMRFIPVAMGYYALRQHDVYVHKSQDESHTYQTDERMRALQEKVIPDACAAKANTVGQGDTAG